jgi:hypothetical protein
MRTSDGNSEQKHEDLQNEVKGPAGYYDIEKGEWVKNRFCVTTMKTMILKQKLTTFWTRLVTHTTHVQAVSGALTTFTRVASVLGCPIFLWVFTLIEFQYYIIRQTLLDSVIKFFTGRFAMSPAFTEETMHTESCKIRRVKFCSAVAESSDSFRWSTGHRKFIFYEYSSYTNCLKMP